ncbi:MAG TPA: manganese efflux pump [Bryobacteraceae bacterium]
MTVPVLLLGILAGLDNLQVCSSVGLVPLQGPRRHALAAAFSICEIMAPLIGLALGHLLLSALQPVSAKAGPIMVLVCGVVVLIRFGSPAWDSRMLFGLPISLSLDNLTVGAGIGALPGPAIPPALLIGAISALMSCAGLYCGAWLRRFAPRRIELVAGSYLCLLAVRMLISEGI